MSTFGFSVHHGYLSRDPEMWTVNLPHQCDSWDITDPNAEGLGDSKPVPHEVAVARMEAFVAEAQKALQALRERRELVEDW